MRTALMVLLSLTTLTANAPVFALPTPSELFADSKLVFVGRVRAVRSSGITTSLESLPWWEGVRFQWLLAEVEVMQPFKGVRKGEIVNFATLHYDDHNGTTAINNPPESPEPEKGDVYLLCLAATPQTNVFAALTAPYHENDSIIALHRIGPPKSQVDAWAMVRSHDNRYAPILSLCNSAGQLLPEAVERISRVYAADLAATSTNKLIYLEWETVVSPSGVRSDVPKGSAK